MNGFMSCIHGLDKTKGLDLLLHTPGGEVNATEALVTYLRSVFGKDIRAFVPQIAMSAGTMIALSCSEIWMGKHSSIGPIDPQVGGVPAHGIVEEFQRASTEIKTTPVLVNVWEPILRRYHPTLVGQCEKAIEMADKIVRGWLPDGAVAHIGDDKEKSAAVNRVLSELGEHKTTLNHGRHVSADKAEKIGLNVRRLESDSALQDLVLSVHHSYCLTFTKTPAIKIIENHTEKAYVAFDTTAKM
jgi:ClpP class serine protease